MECSKNNGSKVRTPSTIQGVEYFNIPEPAAVRIHLFGRAFNQKWDIRRIQRPHVRAKGARAFVSESERVGDYRARLRVKRVSTRVGVRSRTRQRTDWRWFIFSVRPASQSAGQLLLPLTSPIDPRQVANLNIFVPDARIDPGALVDHGRSHVDLWRWKTDRVITVGLIVVEGGPIKHVEAAERRANGRLCDWLVCGSEIVLARLAVTHVVRARE